MNTLTVTQKHLPTLSKTSFLEELALTVLNNKNMGACAVVLPSFRSVTSFKRVFTRKATKACRMPQVMTLGAFMEGNGEFQIADNLEILARLYQVQLNYTKEKKDFGLFLNWGSVALADFHQIDHHMKDANQVFKNLRDIKEIEEWSFDTSKKLTEDQISFMNQWDRLPHLYKDLHERLKQDGMTTKAMLSWDVAKKGNVQKYKTVYAAGLAAITPSEKLYLTKWHEAGKLIYLPDADVSYVHEGQIEAGYFIRELGEFSYSIPDKISQSPPDIEIIGCSSVMSSCQLIRQIVLELNEDEKNKTVIVLPDAGTLPVLLQALPNNEVGYNVTMGLSIRETPISPFLNLIDRMTARSDKGWRFEELVSLASQQVVLEYTEKTTSFKSDSTNSLHELAKMNSGWVAMTTIEEVSDGAFYSLLQDLQSLKAQGAKEFLRGLDDFSRKIEENLQKSKNPWIKAGWTSVRKVVSIMLRLQSDLNPCNSASDVRALMHKLLGGEKINLIGEPARGLQIMGLTETRALDYDRVIIMDCNEGILPKHEIIDSYLPADLKYSINMPGRHEREAAYAYSVYRLLNRSTKVQLLYRTCGKGSEEMSRYLQQFIHSYKPIKDKFTKSIFSMPSPKARPEIPVITLTEKMRERIEVWAKEGISPSALNKLLSCERNFIYRYLLRLLEPNELEERLESSTLGSIVHHVFEHGLNKALMQTLEPHHIKSILKNLDTFLDNAVDHCYKHGVSDSGENLLLIRSAKSTIKKILNQELLELNTGKTDPITITGLEDSFEATYSLVDGGEVKFFGYADRLEDVAGVTRVVDYKTGITTQTDLNLKVDWDIEGGKLDKGNASKALQLLVYCAILLNDESLSEVKASIRSGRNARSGLLNLKIGKRTEINREDIDMLIDWISNRLSNFKEDGREISHNEDSHYCEYCVVLDPPIISY